MDDSNEFKQLIRPTAIMMLITGVVILLMLLSMNTNADPTVAFTIDEREKSELHRPYDYGNNTTVQSGRISMSGIDSFNGYAQSSQWTVVSNSIQPDRASSIGQKNNMLYMQSSNDVSGSLTHIYQDAIFPNNHSVDIKWQSDTYNNWGAIGTIDGEAYNQTTAINHTGFAVYVRGTYAYVGYIDTSNTTTIISSTSSQTYNWTLSVERNSTHFIGWAINTDTSVKISGSVLISSVNNGTNQTNICIGDFGAPFSGQYYIDCYFDNYNSSNKSPIGNYGFYQYNLFGSNVTWLNFTGNLNSTYIFARSHNNYSALKANPFTNITGILESNNISLNCTLGTPITGSTIEFIIYFNYSEAFIDKIKLGGWQRNQTYNLTVGATSLYEDVYDALNGTTHGDTVYVDNNTYENNIIYSYTNVTIEGQDNQTSTLKYSPTLSYLWQIKNIDYNLTFKNINMSTSNVGIYRTQYLFNDDSELHIEDCRFFDAYYPIYLSYSNITVKNSFFDYNKTSPTGTTRKAIRIENGNITFQNSTTRNYYTGVYGQQTNGLVDNNTFYCISRDIDPYDDAGGVIIYPWTQNGTTIVKNNLMYNASWGISIEEPDQLIVYGNTIYESDIGISTVQRAGQYYQRPQWRGFGGYSYIHNNTIIGDMTFTGIQSQGIQYNIIENNQLYYQNTSLSYRAAMMIYNQYANEGDGVQWGKSYINNTIMDKIGSPFRTFSYGSAYGSQEIHINGLNATNATNGITLLQVNRSSTFENISIQSNTLPIEGLTVQVPLEGSIKNTIIDGYYKGLIVQGYNRLSYENITIKNCGIGVDYMSSLDIFHLDYWQDEQEGNNFYYIDTSENCTIDARSTYPDGSYILENNATMKFIAPSYGTTAHYFTANNKSIQIVGVGRILSDRKGNAILEYAGVQYDNITIRDGINRLYLADRLFIHNTSTQSVTNITLKTNDENFNLKAIVRRFDIEIDSINDANGITFSARPNNEYKVAIYHPLDPIFDLTDDTGTLIMNESGAICSATVMIIIFMFVSVFALLAVAQTKRGIGKIGRRRR